tara:strand:- start:162 stop:398 length:237 start_codon:yes stop_codon:yes gene_type:complete
MDFIDLRPDIEYYTMSLERKWTIHLVEPDESMGTLKWRYTILDDAEQMVKTGFCLHSRERTLKHTCQIIRELEEQSTK